jgi:hypothetical protein
MSLKLSGSEPRITARTFSENITLIGDNNDIEIPLDDFCALVEYVLTNTDLKKNDPRLALIEKIKQTKIIPGLNKGGTRIGFYPL